MKELIEKIMEAGELLACKRYNRIWDRFGEIMQADWITINIGYGFQTALRVTSKDGGQMIYWGEIDDSESIANSNGWIVNIICEGMIYIKAGLV